ncbi:Splicing factor 3A subunit 3 [Monoraphidium neglectum]|uniref:Splicing factor 3A subunit 3 n=1 Tax=Monoraphidium neglectum TaxID=145388 RepID=A0A0D2M0J0_9CHLO|nr:Splicing factor 3A subunit 3 [Monoraphidium neglectum]KIY97134.1 Splicing factor 3A subunit 3 [Monoraphidium neglectum]|eukprot:XP_013896154.1 Splicing factor 3A subunit 3 [Monoraphidium neglectum]
MANTFIEQIRVLHEEVERLERLIVKDYRQEGVKGHRDKLMQNHRVRARLDQIADVSRKLLRAYKDGEDECEARREEISALGAVDQTRVFANFYERLKDVRDYHRRFPVHDVTGAEDDSAAIKEEPAIPFTGEEGLGRYLDMHELHRAFTNARFGRQLDYVEYLSSFADFSTAPKHLKLGQPYRQYVQQLLDYLISFYERTQPLAQLRRQLDKLEEELRGQFEAGAAPGWEDQGGAQGGATAEELGVDLEAFDSVEEVEIMGADRLKEALTTLGLKAGGTTRQRAERLYAAKGRRLDELDPKHFAKGSALAAARDEAALAKRRAAAWEACALEGKVRRLAELLANVVSDTKGRVEKKQAQTYEEMLAELEEAEAEAGAAPDDEDDEDEYVYNPLKLPLGWDGKPIPYWLYKLHGLNQEFKCEICGNFSYFGRRAFERHFKEWRHVNGMRALGIPNTKDFYEVTKIEDAMALWKTQQSRQTGGFNPETDEELEDQFGNVYNKKTYEDLRRQGII